MTHRSTVRPEPPHGGRGAGERDVGPEAADLGGIQIGGVTRRRMLQVASGLAVAWLAIAFLRQVGDVTAASSRADALRSGNANLALEVAALEDELRLIQRQEYIVQQARGYRLGTAKEVPFTISQPATSLGLDAPGSAGVRVGAAGMERSALDAWLSLLFGPDR